MDDLIERLKHEAAAWDDWNEDHPDDAAMTTPPLLREAAAAIEALRAEVGETKEVAVRAMRQRDDQYNRAERLAEALALLPDDSGMIEHSPEEGPFMFCCGREVTYDRLHGPVCTHDEDCWYAQMRVLLDHGH